MEKRITSLGDLEHEARNILQILVPDERATLVTLSGELGAGKTAFTQIVARVLGVEEAVTSPTFVLEKIYELPEGGLYKRLVHIDAYRLSDSAELRTLGFAELCADPGNLILLEWPERVKDALPPPAVSVTLRLNDDGSRTMTYTYA